MASNGFETVLAVYFLYRIGKWIWREGRVPARPRSDFDSLTIANVIPFRTMYHPEEVMADVRKRYAALGIYPKKEKDAKAGKLSFPDILKVALLEPTKERAALGPAQPIFFKDGEPQTFKEYDSQHHILQILEPAVYSLRPDELMLAHPWLFLGTAGMGKTLLAKIVASELDVRSRLLGRGPVRFFEVFPADMNTIAKQDEVILRAHENPGCVLFIDEVHDLSGSQSLKLYLLLEEHRYQFEGMDQPVKLNPFTILGATTDYGSMHPALKRRWINKMLRPMNEKQLVETLMKRKTPMDRPAAELLVSRTKYSGAPWEALDVLRQAYPLAVSRGHTEIMVEDVASVFDADQVDELGLSWLDRRVIEALFLSPKYRNGPKGQPQQFVCFAAAEHDTCMLAGIDKGAYRESIFPKLMSRGLLLKRATYGQCLTDKAVKLYRHLAKAA